jgi:hypothetical protein
MGKQRFVDYDRPKSSQVVVEFDLQATTRLGYHVTSEEDHNA